MWDPGRREDPLCFLCLFQHTHTNYSSFPKMDILDNMLLAKHMSSSSPTLCHLAHHYDLQSKAFKRGRHLAHWLNHHLGCLGPVFRMPGFQFHLTFQPWLPDSNAWEAEGMAQVPGFPPRTRETWIQVPGFGWPSSSYCSIWAVNQHFWIFFPFFCK